MIYFLFEDCFLTFRASFHSSQRTETKLAEKIPIKVIKNSPNTKTPKLAKTKHAEVHPNHNERAINDTINAKKICPSDKRSKNQEAKV